MAKVGVLGPTANPFNLHCNCFIATQKQQPQLPFSYHSCSFLWWFLVSEWQETGNSRRKRPALLPPSKQLWSARFPNLSRNPPTIIYLPVKFRVRAKLQKRLVIKVSLWLGQGIFGLIRQLFNYQVSPLFGSFLQDS